MRGLPPPPTFFCKSIIPGGLPLDFDKSIIPEELLSYFDKSIILLHLIKRARGALGATDRTDKWPVSHVRNPSMLHCTP